MKALICIVLTLAVFLPGASGQGKINFSTFNFAPVTNLITGQPIPAGPSWWAQLYYGPHGITDWSQLVSVTNAPVHFAIPGYILEPVPRYTDPAIVAGGAFGVFQVRVWTAVLGATWAEAYNAWLTGPATPDRLLGKSNLATIRTADVNVVPPQIPASLEGKQLGEVGLLPFAVGIPEPGVIWLTLLGALAWVFRRQESS